MQGTSAADGSTCVWCTVAAYGVCVDADQAEIIEQSLPMADCDGAPPPDNDDDVAPADDDTPSDYWTCLKDSSDKDSCVAAGCAWCVSSTELFVPTTNLNVPPDTKMKQYISNLSTSTHLYL